MDTVDSDSLLLAIGKDYIQVPILTNWSVILGNLISLRQICIEIVLPVEIVQLVDGTI
ncbi:hypothetical protein D3C71_2067580 [compost metagenome]